jgi:hypothetical protein
MELVAIARSYETDLPGLLTMLDRADGQFWLDQARVRRWCEANKPVWEKPT